MLLCLIGEGEGVGGSGEVFRDMHSQKHGVLPCFYHRAIYSKWHVAGLSLSEVSHIQRQVVLTADEPHPYMTYCCG